jgi:hypothetical protein
MNRSTIEDVRARLGQENREDLEALVLASMQLHARTCEVASVEPAGAHEDHEKSRHRTDVELRELISGKSTDELVELLAPFAYLARALGG